MGLITGPVVICDECDGLIEIGDEVVTVIKGTIYAVIPGDPPRALIEQPEPGSYYHPECAEPCENCDCSDPDCSCTPTCGTPPADTGCDDACCEEPPGSAGADLVRMFAGYDPFTGLTAPIAGY